MSNNNKGYTLVEVVLCVALLAIVIAPIGFMLINQSKSAKDNSNKMAVSQNAQTVMATFRTKCLPASGVSELKTLGGSNALDDSTADLEFSKLKIFNKYKNEYTTYEYNPSTKTFTYNGADIADNVTVYLSPLPDSATYANCRGLKVKINSFNTDAGTGKTHNVDLENQFYFRNSN